VCAHRRAITDKDPRDGDVMIAGRAFQVGGDHTRRRGDQRMTSTDEWVLSDMRDAGEREWRAFSDRVMGGISREHVSVAQIDGLRCLRLQGEVRLEHNGGFIQIVRALQGTGGTPLDVSPYAGVRLLVWAHEEQEYLVHLRTRDTTRPWQYYRAAFSAGPTWRTITLPFDGFHPEQLRQPLDRRTLTSLGIVAYGRRFHADIAVARVALYR
jgi:hypothetical protein